MSGRSAKADKARKPLAPRPLVGLLLRRMLRRAPQVVPAAGGGVEAAEGQQTRVLRIKPLDVTYRRLIKRALAPLQTRHGQ